VRTADHHVGFGNARRRVDQPARLADQIGMDRENIAAYKRDLPVAIVEDDSRSMEIIVD
jgi:hypothetical protein